MKIDKHDAEWKLSAASGETLGYVREWLGSYYIYRSVASHTQPDGPYRSMNEAIRSLEQRQKCKKGQVYYRGALTRRRENEDV